MSPDALAALRSRVDRAHALLERKGANGFVQQFEVNGETHTHTIQGVKAPDQLEDEMLMIFVWLWSLKDHLKQAYARRNLKPELIEEIVNRSPQLQYVSDIANRAKHGELRKSRSGQYAELVDVGITIPHTAVSSLQYLPNAVNVSVAKPDEVQLLATLKLRSGKRLDAFSVLEQAQSTWEHEAFARLAA
jgi:hypothetical protein